MLEQKYEDIIMLGDYNGVINPEWDRNSRKPIKDKQGKLPKSFFRLMENVCLIDTWRHLYDKAREYTHRSERHNSMARIDLILVTQTLSKLLKEMEIKPRLISDHNPQILKLKETIGEKSFFRWRLNVDLLRNEEIIKNTKTVIYNYFKENANKGTGIEIVWDAAKAVIRGHLIQQNIIVRRRRNQDIDQLNKKLKEKENLSDKNPKDEKLLMECKLLRDRISLELAEEVGSEMKKANQQYFENANKPGKWLAYKLKKKKREKIDNKDKER